MRRTPLLACACVAACLAPATAPSAQAGTHARAIVQNINQFRQANGVYPMRFSRALTRSARSYSRRVLRADRFGHAYPIRTRGRFRHLGEALAFSWGRKRGGAVRLWKRSGSHRALLLSSRFNWAGAARVTGRFGGRRATVWTLRVGRR